MKNPDTKTNLLKTGVQLFGKNGYHGTGIKEVVDSLKVPKGSFYNYFKSKEDFAAEIISYYSEQVDKLWESFISSEQGNDSLLMLQNAFERMILSLESNRVQTGCLIGNIAGELAESSKLCRSSLNKAKETWCARLEHHIDRAQASGSARNDIPAEKLAGFCWDLWEGALLRMKLENSTESVRETITMLFTVFLKP